MNKQQLASKIWQSANKMRSKIEANEYKDYILGFMFYKFISDKEENYLINKIGLEKEDFKDEVVESNEEIKENCKENLGYFIPNKYLFSTWTSKGKEFGVDDVVMGLNCFERNINETHKKLFENIFNTLQTGLSKLGDTTGKQTKAIEKLLELIKIIPMDGKQGYDVLGFIYEYLISNFAANAGKKAGEFYTPHEVSVLMSDIIAHHLQDRETIEIYDPTSGSGSLLLNIGESISKYMKKENSVKYYAQEWKENTYNLTRMNLVMHGITPANIVTRNADTLEDDWPYFDENDKDNTYTPLRIDAVVSNPPYSQPWDPDGKENDPRYKRFEALAPKSKADYAFLLHDLYHLKPDGIMTIVLPHGVLSRGGVEETIRKNLVENDHIETIIGLPPNIFYGTNISTIIMVLKQKRESSDVLIVDASKGFIKDGNKNKLNASDIKKIVDTVIERKEGIEKYSKLVSKADIRKNEYNLNIPRYVDSSDDMENWDLYASMYGGIPNSEVDDLDKYWTVFPSLKDELFETTSIPYSNLKTNVVNETITNNSDVKDFEESHKNTLDNLDKDLYNELIDNMLNINVPMQEAAISKNIFNRLEPIPLIDKYNAYQILDDKWQQIAIDLEIIQTEGFEATKEVKPNMVMKKNNKTKNEEVQDGWVGNVIPFELVHKTLLKTQADELKSYENNLTEIQSQYSIIIEEFSEEEKEANYINDSKDGFKSTELNAKVKEIQDEIVTDEINVLNGYLSLLDSKPNKSQKVDYINNNVAHWNNIQANKDGTYGKANVVKYIKVLKDNYQFDDDSIESKLIKVKAYMDEEKELKKTIRVKTQELEALTINTIENLPDDEVYYLLTEKWINPLVNDLKAMPEQLIEELADRVEYLKEKYELTMIDIDSNMKDTEKTLCSMIGELVGDEYDMQGLKMLQELIGGRNKCDKLQKVKKSLLQKMFPQKSEKTPKLRFDGFTDDWEELYFYNLFDYERPEKYIIKDKKYCNYGIPVLTANKAFLLGHTNENFDYYDKNICILFDDFTLDNKLVNFKFKINSSAIKILTCKDNYFIYFTYYLLNQTKILKQGHARHYISIVQNTKTRIPKKTEQTKIGELFKNLDKLIALNENKLAKLQNIKKALSQKMFV